jgi:hypothetical protein
MFQRLIGEVFRLSGTHFSVLPEYALIDTGFDIITPDGERTPAGIVVRQAHRRPRGGGFMPAFDSPEQRVVFQVEISASG